MKSKQELLAALDFYGRLSPEDKLEIELNAKIEQFTAGDLIYSPAKECLGMLLVAEGVIRTCLVSEEGKRATIFRLRQGDVCVLAMSCLIPAITFDVEVEAEEECRVLVIPTIVLQRIEKNNLYLENFIYRMGTEKLSAVMEAVTQLLFMTLEQRTVTFLLDEASIRGTEILRMTQEEVARNIGSAREAVTRVLNGLKGEGLLAVSRGKIELLDRKALYEKV